MGFAGLFLALGPMIFMGIAGQFNLPGMSDSVNEFIGKLALLAFVAFGPGFILAGLVFPLTISWAAESAGDHDGKRLGVLLGINGLGGALGAEFAYRVLLPWLTLHLAMGAVALAYAVAGLALVLSHESRAGSQPNNSIDRGSRRKEAPNSPGQQENVRTSSRRLLQSKQSLSRIACQAGAVAGVLLLAKFGLSRLPLVNTHQALAVLDHHSGREGSVAVVEKPKLWPLHSDG